MHNILLEGESDFYKYSTCGGSTTSPVFLVAISFEFPREMSNGQLLQRRKCVMKRTLECMTTKELETAFLEK